MTQETIDSLIAQINDACSDQKKGMRPGTARAIVEREVDCDTGKLYGPLPGAIAYLQEIAAKYPKAELDEKWTGYEDMYMRFAWSEPQTDEEYARSLTSVLSHEKYKRNQRDEERAVARAKLLAEQKRIAAKLKALG